MLIVFFLATLVIKYEMSVRSNHEDFGFQFFQGCHMAIKLCDKYSTHLNFYSSDLSHKIRNDPYVMTWQMVS